MRNNVLSFSVVVVLEFKVGKCKAIKWWGIWVLYCVCEVLSYRKGIGGKFLRKWENLFGFSWKGKVSVKRDGCDIVC